MTDRLEPKLVSIGSISAASLLIAGFPDRVEALTAVVPTTDTGSSTGLIRERFSMPAPGDVRAVLAAMATKGGDKAALGRLFEYRFRAEHLPELSGIAMVRAIHLCRKHVHLKCAWRIFHSSIVPPEYACADNQYDSSQDEYRAEREKVKECAPKHGTGKHAEAVA